MADCFVAYPSRPPEVGQTISACLKLLKDDFGITNFHSWEENDIPGRFLVDPILQSIKDGVALVADVTRLNFNVTFEIGFAIGTKKRVFLVKNGSLKDDEEIAKEIGVFDTIGYKAYPNSRKLSDYLRTIHDVRPLPFHETKINHSAPVYVVQQSAATDFKVRIISRLKKTGLRFRSFDPTEQGRMPANEAIANVASSHGLVVPLLEPVSKLI